MGVSGQGVRFGFATPSERSWFNGGSPTNGFLGSAKGPFNGFYYSIAGTGIADALFMTALLGVGRHYCWASGCGSPPVPGHC